MKETYKQLQTESIRDAVNGHSDHLKSLEQRCSALETNISTMKQEVEGMVEEKLKNVTKLETKGFAKEIRAKITEELNSKLKSITASYDSQIERLKSDYRDLSENMLRARISTKPIEHGMNLSETSYANLGIITYGPVSQLQKFIDDSEMIYGLKIVYASTCNNPYRFELVRKKQGDANE